MHRRAFLAGFLSLALNGSAALAQTVVTDFAGLQAAFVNDAVIEVRGPIIFPTSLIGSPRNVTIHGEGSTWMAATAAPLISFSGQRLTINGPIMWNDQPGGVGLLFTAGAGSIHLSRVQINTRGHGIIASGTNGAGLWISDIHMNGLAPGSFSIGIQLGQWDTAFLSGVLIEEHDTGMRVAMGGHSANIMVSNVVIDRALLGIVVDPSYPSDGLANLLIDSLWVACNRPTAPPSWASGLSVNASSGRVATIRASAIYATGCPQAWNLYGEAKGGGFSVGWSSH